jgi:Protein of unknown function (DUF3224)
MNKRAGLGLALCLSAAASAMAGAEQAVIHTLKGSAMSSRASGTFEVQIKPLPNDEKVPGLTVGRMGFDKEWKGDLAGTSKGEMMTVGTSVDGSAGYVAVEQMTGTLKGRSGSFALLHHGTMKGGDFSLTITVVPDSGTGQLVGLSGKLAIIITDGKHSYDFDYTLPDAP